MIIEEPKVLPNNLYMPDYLGVKVRDYQESTCWVIKPEGDNGLYIEGIDGVGHRFTNGLQFLDLANKYRSVFTCCVNNELDLIYRLFSRTQLKKLDSEKEFKHNVYRVIQYYPNRIDIRRGPYWTSIYNILPFTKINLDTIGRLKEWYEKLLRFQTLFDLETNVSSPSASSTAILTQLSEKIYQEFLRRNDLSNDDLNLVYSTIHNTWMEPTFIGQGNIEFEGIDLVAAHLEALGLIPSIRRGKSQITRGKYHPNALMGFYKAEVSFPAGHKFGLVPIRYKNKCIAPEGDFTVYLPKPYLDKLTELHIPFKVIDSIEFLPIGNIEYPYKNYVGAIKLMLKHCQEELYPLEVKMLTYKTLVGMMQHFHLPSAPSDDDSMPDDFVWSTSAIFNPMVASTVYGLVNIWVWEILEESKNPVYRRHDAVTREVEELTNNKFKQENLGEIYIFSSCIYDKPREDRWFHIAKECRSAPYLALIWPDRKLSRVAAGNEPSLIGQPKDYFQSLRPNPDKRLLVKPIKFVGETLENTIKTQGIVKVEQLDDLLWQNYNGELLENRWAPFHVAPKRR